MSTALTIPGDISATGGNTFQSFEQDYLALRQAEHRIYTDDELQQLPDVAASHPHHREWIIRKRSADKLITWLTAKARPLKILEVGCGNGWLSKRLSEIPGSNVTGSDINYSELQQAAAVFANVPDLYFVYGDIRGNLFKEASFDAVVFAASIQYFPTLQAIIPAARELLKLDGEIHILDSPFYRRQELPAAKNRTQEYFRSIGFEKMADHYFHHSLEELQQVKHRVLYNPSSAKYFFAKNKNPFPWICIT